MAGAIEVRGARELRRDLKAADKAWPRELAKVHREIARKVQATARAHAAGGTRQQAAAAGAIRASGTTTSARLRIAKTQKAPFAAAAFWGVRGRSGWYARPRYASSTTPQGSPWVGASWEAGKRGEGPYALNSAIADEAPWVMRRYLEGVDDVYARAFPD